jgi:hypothetical protein
MENILHAILADKRPTNNPEHCFNFTTALLDTLNISHVGDIHGNITVDRGGDTCFTSHTDTVNNKLGENTLVLDSKGLVRVEGGGVLGADDGAGMYVMTRMILAGKSGLYVFFATEEQGRLGSSNYAMPEHIKKCVSFDRKGYDNLITHQMSEEGCSVAFADAFIAQFDLPYKKDPTGSFTDSYTFFESVSECINLSVGYFDQHTKNESLDVVFLEKLVDACISMDWESLPTKRDPEVYRFTVDYKYGSDKSYGDWGNYSYNYKGKHALFNESMEDYVYDHPEIVAAYLEDIGVEISELKIYGRAFEQCYSDGEI